MVTVWSSWTVEHSYDIVLRHWCWGHECSLQEDGGSQQGAWAKEPRTERAAATRRISGREGAALVKTNEKDWKWMKTKYLGTFGMFGAKSLGGGFDSLIAELRCWKPKLLQHRFLSVRIQSFELCRRLLSVSVIIFRPGKPYSPIFWVIRIILKNSIHTVFSNIRVFTAQTRKKERKGFP